jgi:spore maturation protein CgeB
MSYKIVRLTNLYNEYIALYYSSFPDIKNRSYEEQHEHLVNNSFDAASSFVRQLNERGVEAFDIFTNAIHLQNRWKAENNCDKVGKELAAQQIKTIKPDVVWLDDISLIDENWISSLKVNVPTLKIVTGHLCAPYHEENIRNIRALDFIITCTPCIKREFESHGIKAHLLYHAFDTHLLQRIHIDNHYPEIDLLFTGSLYTGGPFHKTRIEYIEKLLKSGLPLKLYGNIDTDKKIFSKMSAYYAINSLKKIGGQQIINQIPFLKKYESFGETPVKTYSKKLKGNLLPPVYGIEQFKLLSKSNLCFNLHIDMAKSCAGNARMFEATGAGSCLITDWKENLPELFEPEKEVVTYRSIEECIEKIKWLLNNPSESKKIAEAGQRRTLRDHTVEKRTILMDEMFREKLAKR